MDWKIEKNGDSGIYLRGQPQVQIWDSDNTPGARGEDKNSGSGGLWNNPLPADVAKSKDNALKLKEGQKIGKMPLKKADKPVGEWNTFHIIMKGDKVTVYLNGELVVDNKPLAELLATTASRCRRRGRSSCSTTATRCGSRTSTSRNCRRSCRPGRKASATGLPGAGVRPHGRWGSVRDGSLPAAERAPAGQDQDKPVADASGPDGTIACPSNSRQ